MSLTTMATCWNHRSLPRLSGGTARPSLGDRYCTRVRCSLPSVSRQRRVRAPGTPERRASALPEDSRAASLLKPSDSKKPRERARSRTTSSTPSSASTSGGCDSRGACGSACVRRAGLSPSASASVAAAPNAKLVFRVFIAGTYAASREESATIAAGSALRARPAVRIEM